VLQGLASATAEFEIKAADVETQSLRQSILWHEPLHPINCTPVTEQQQRWQRLHSKKQMYVTPLGSTSTI
jgi:hypothetical protein